jgi:hypothetical protein
LTAAVLLSACSVNQVVVEGSFPPPLMNTVPLTLGVFYEDEFANHEFYEETKSRQQSDWVVKTGQAQVQMWDVLLGGMFENLVHLPARPTAENKNPLVDAVLIPHIEELQYALPVQTNVKVYEIWMRYRFEMVTPDGDTIAEWTMTAYGKTPTAFMQSSVKAVNLAAVMALRDAGAHFVVLFFREPAVQEWIDQIARTDHE